MFHNLIPMTVLATCWLKDSIENALADHESWLLEGGEDTGKCGCQFVSSTAKLVNHWFVMYLGNKVAR